MGPPRWISGPHLPQNLERQGLIALTLSLFIAPPRALASDTHGGSGSQSSGRARD